MIFKKLSNDVSFGDTVTRENIRISKFVFQATRTIGAILLNNLSAIVE